MLNQNIEKLNKVLSYLKEVFVGKNEIIDLLGISLVARENAFLLGPPGTAKSAIARQLSNCIEGGKNFEYLLTRFTEPSEIYGPFDIRKLKEGDLITNTDGMLPEASMIFLDEIFNANSALLNSLLMALNERIFKRGKETKKLPALIFIGASNILPEDEALNALLDRFLIRIKCDYVHTDLLEKVLAAGWKLENTSPSIAPSITPDEIKQIQLECRSVNILNIQKKYIDLIHNLRNTGVKVSDRRAVKLQNVIAASAVICGRKEAILSDLWVLKYIWDSEEQIEILSGIIDKVIENDAQPNAHPQSTFNKVPNAEDLMKEIKLLSDQWDTGKATFEEKNIIKDKLRYVQSRCNWVSNSENKLHLQKEIESIWQKMLQTI